MIEIRYTGDALWERIERAKKKIERRIQRVTKVLNYAEIEYAVIGDRAVELRVSQIDESVVRNTRDVDLILNRSDLPAAIETLEREGMIYREVSGISMFLDGPDAKARDAVHVVFAGEKVRSDYPEAVPAIQDYELIEKVRTLPFEALVRMKLCSFRDKDRVHLRDLISVGMIDESWVARLSNELGSRLQQLLDDPDG